MQVNFYNLHNDHSYKKNHNASQIESEGIGAIRIISSLVTGWVKTNFRACKCIPPLGLLLSKPYFKSPFIGEPMAES